MNQKGLHIFVSYDNKSDNPEERWLDRLLQFLKPLNLDNSISIWADTELRNRLKYVWVFSGIHEISNEIFIDLTKGDSNVAIV